MYNAYCGVRDADLGTWITDATTRAYYNDGGQEVDLTPTVDGNLYKYSVPENTTIYFEFSKTNYRASTDSLNVTSEGAMLVKTLITTKRRFRFSRVKNSSSGMQNVAFCRMTLKKATDDSIKDQVTPDNRGDTSSEYTNYYFPNGTFDFNQQYIEGESLVNDINYDFWKSTGESFGSTPGKTWDPPITWLKSETALDVVQPYKDAMTGEDIQVTGGYNIYFEYGNPATRINAYHCTATGVNKWIVNRNVSGVLQAGRFVCEIDLHTAGYEPKTIYYPVEQGQQIQEITFDNIELMPLPESTTMTVSVSDAEHGTAISDATVTVVDDSTSQEVLPESGIYTLVYNQGKTYTVTVTKTDYTTYTETITPSDDNPIALAVQLQKILKYCKLYVTAKNAKSETVDAAIVVYDEYDHAYIAKSDDHWNLICNDDEPYHVEISADGYYDYTGDTFTPDSEDDITLTVTLDKIPVYATLYVTAEDEETLEEIPDADIDVYDITAHEYVEKTGIFWKLLAEEDHEYRIDVSHPDYYDYAEQFEAPEAAPIFKTCKMIARPTFATLTVEVKDADTKEVIPDADITVRNETKGEIIEPEDGIWLLQTGDDNYRIYATKTGYTDAESVIFQAPEEADIYKVLYMNTKLEPFATVSDLSHRTGISYTTAEKERLSYLLEDVSNLIRSEGRKCGVDVDAKVSSDRIYASIVKTVTCDVTQRVMRQSQTGDAMSQESQSALGYTWSGTYAIPGGGTAMSLMRNEKDILGFDAMTIGVIDLC